MSYLVSLPDGRNVEFPDSVPRDKAAEIIRQQLGGSKDAPSAPSSIGDIATSFGLGAIGSTKALTDVAGAGNAASRALDSASESLSRAYTPQRQAEIERRQQLIKEAEKSGSTWEEIKANLGSVAEAPLQSAAQGLGSIVPFALTGGVGSAAKLLPTTVKTINTLMGAAAGAGAVKGSIYDAVHDRLVQEGQPEEVARQQAVAAQEYLGKNAGQIALGTGIGAAAGRYGVESLLTPGAAKAAEAQLGRRVGTALVGEMPLEGLQGGQERLAANVALQNQGYNVPTFEGVAGQATQEATMAGLAAGPVAAARSPAAETQRQKDEEDKKLREERRVAEATDLARKQTPEYAFEVEQKYLALEKQRTDLKAQRIKIDESSPTVAADKAHNKELDKKIEELGRNEIAPLAKEYNTVKPLLDASRKKAELEKISPEDAMLSYLGIAAPAAPTTATAPRPLRIDDFGQVTDEPLATEIDPVQAYAQEQVTAARESGQLDMASMADYLMQDPAKAAQVVAERPAIEGFDRKQLAALYGGVGLRLKDLEKQGFAASKAELAQRQEDLQNMQPKGPTVDQLDMFKSSTEQVEENRRTGELNFDFLDPLFEKSMEGKAPVIAVSPDVRPSDKAPAMRERIGALIQEADQADKDYRQARALKERPAASEAFTRRSAALKQLDALGAEGGAYAQNLIAARRAQESALATLEETTQRLKSQELLGKEDIASATTESLNRRAENARAQFITNALQEAALNRRAAGKEALTQDEAIKAASKLYDTVNDWVERAATQAVPAKYEEKIVQPAQMRANKIVRPAVTERVETEPAIQGISPAEVKHFKSRIKDVRDQLGEVPSAPTRVETWFRKQFPSTEAERIAAERGEKDTTLGGELRKRTEYVRNKMSRMQLTPANLGTSWMGTRNALNKAADVLDAGRATRDVLDAVEPVVDAVLGGRSVSKADMQAIYDAISAGVPTAIEQKEAGQKALFPETEKDLGYIRMTPKNFANSPKIMEAWSALDKARALAKKTAAKEAIVNNRSKAVATTISRLNSEIDRVKNDTKFFWTNTKQWTDRDLAKAYIGYPEIGNNTEEQKLVDRYLADKGAGLSAQEKEQVAELLRQFNSKKMPEYQKHLKEAEQILAQNGRLDDLDNQLLHTMQNANKSIRDQAAALRKELAVMQTAIKQMRSISKTDRKDPLAKRINALEAKAEQAKSQYRERVEQLFTKSRKQMDEALAEILDPDIKQVTADLAKAQKTLEKEKAELERVAKKVEAVLTQSEGKDRMQLVAYEQFRYEEKKSIIEDLEKKIKEQQDDLENSMDTRMNAHDTAAAVMEAVTDKKVQNLRDRIIDLEQNVATLRGEKITAAEPGRGSELPALKYPFAAQKAEAELKAMQAELKGAERQQAETAQEIKSQSRQLEDVWREMWGGFGKRRVEGRVETLTDTEQKRLDKLRDDAFAAADRSDFAQQRADEKRAYVQTLEDQTQELVAELSAMPKLADDVTELLKLVEDDTTPPSKFNVAMAKLGLLQQIEELQAQMEAVLEGKPHRKQKALTAETTAQQSARTPFRTGDLEAGVERRFQAYRERTGYTRALSPEEFAQMEKAELAYSNELAKGILGTKAPKLAVEGLGRGKKPSVKGSNWDEDYEFSRGKPSKGLNVDQVREEIAQGLGEDMFERNKEHHLRKLLDIYPSPKVFMEQNPEYKGKIPADAKGFVHKEKAVLFANNIGKGEALGVMLHEVGVHIGFRNFFNQGQYNALVKTVKNWAARNDDSLEARVGKAAMAKVNAANTPANQVNDELLAYAVEEAMRMGVEPTGVKKGVLQNWLKMVVDAFKKALQSFGINPKNLTAGDLVNFAYGCAQLEVKGTWHGAGVYFKEFDHEYMGTGEGRQAYGHGSYRAQKYGGAAFYRRQEVRKQMEYWRENPKVKAWEETQKPKIAGLSKEALEAYAAGEKPLDPILYGITKDEATVLADILLIQERLADEQFGYSPTPFEAVTEAMNEVRTMVEDGIQPSPEISDKVYEKVFKGITDGKYPVTGVHKTPLYKGREWYEIDDTEVRQAAYEVTRQLRANKKPATEADIQKILDSKIAQEQDFVDSIVGDIDFEENLQKQLDVLKGLNAADFAFNPPTQPPIPTPKGFMHRTLHTRPENEYLFWDEPFNNQSKYVREKYAEMVGAMPKKTVDSMKDYVARHPKPTGRTYYNALVEALVDGGIPSDLGQTFASEVLYASGIAGNKYFDGSSRRREGGQYNYVDFGDKEEGAQIIATNIQPVNKIDKKGEQILFSRGATYVNDEARSVAEGFDKFIAKNKSRAEKLRAAAGGFLGLETQLVDRFAPLERISKVMDELKGSQMMYYLRMYDQRMHFTSQAVGTGALARVEKIRKDGSKEYVIESRPGASIKGVVQILKDAQPYVGNAEAVNRMFTAYMSAIRAGNKGFAALSFDENVTEQDLRRAESFVNGNKELKTIFDDARREYNDYNRDMMEFLASTGAISEQTRKELTQENDYIPWYRENNGVAELMIGGESRIRIGSITEQPYLHELVGGDKPILDFMTSSVQNTNMLVDMGLRNLATTNAVFELVDLKMAKIVGASTGPDIVKFKLDGEDKYASVEGDKGIPGDLIVKGMEGIPTQMPTVFRIMGMPSRLLRKAVTLSPMYAAKQLFRDSLAAPILSGANFTPVFGALKEIGSQTKETLERRGIVGGQQFTGNNEDLSMILREITDGKPGWMSALAKAESIGMEADALTRRAQYNSYIEQGLSEMEATLMALESMNFSKRGASPSMHIVASMIPFFNSQIQGLNVLYKAATGKLPFNERLKIQEKLLQRGGMMAAATLAYAAVMQDDEAYKNATPEQKYGNWFVRIPGVDEPVRIPVPFEIGYIFKALPEALYNTMVNEHGGEEAVKAFRHILLQTIPGGSSMPTVNGVPIPVPVPQAIKPAIETALGKSFYTERDILSSAEKALLPEEQFRVNTSEAAKAVGRITGTSPVMLEYLVNGYTGAMGLAMLQAVSIGIPKGNTPEQATKRLSEMPVIGGSFQPNDAGGIVNATYDRFENAIKVQRTVDKLFEEGRQADANELLQKTGNEYAVGEVGDFFTSQMKELTQYERAIQAMDMPAAEKRERLDEIKRLKKTLAVTARQTAEEIARQ